ncbi:DUF2835 family protein [Marinomonas agarivorans]|nr:DUF2835 family protein [Marinomonas agarivorans]
MSTIIIDVALAAHRYQKLYQGRAQHLLVQSRDGRKVRLPLVNFRSFLTHEGVYGTFMITFDSNNKLQNIKKMN